MQRAMDFVHAMEDRSFTRREPTRWGTAYFHDDFPVKWALNFIRIDRDDPELTAEVLAEDTHRIQGGAGLAHRKIHVDDQAIGERLAPGFRRAGWVVQHLLLMALREAPQERSEVEVVERTNDELRDARIEAEMAEENNSAEDARMLTDSKVVTTSATNHRNLVGLIDGEIAGWAELYSDGKTAQIEDVGTFERFRNRGVARAVVLRGIDIALSEGHDFFFLVADNDDWPKELYVKLGFEPIGEIYEFMMKSK
jgi:ribosomal protein S18 acetylase RimI-like enzyme